MVGLEWGMGLAGVGMELGWDRGAGCGRGGGWSILWDRCGDSVDVGWAGVRVGLGWAVVFVDVFVVVVVVLLFCCCCCCCCC